MIAAIPTLTEVQESFLKQVKLKQVDGSVSYPRGY